tara:strand:- start:217 stop:1158 length:942 start_codon:yes stop_codon:yes gene_type:complete
MTQDNIRTDTPQETSNEQEFASLEEAVFNTPIEGSNSIEGAFTSGNEGNTESAPEIGQPETSNDEATQQPTQTNNDETRYQYWQSQADKYKNELEAIKQQQAAPVQPEAPAQPAEPAVEEFPPAPPKPQQPRTFNREEAYNDPSSESARYLDELEGWRDDITEYNSLKSQYQTAIIEDKFKKMEQARIEEAKKQQAAQQIAQQTAEVKSHVMGHHGMSESEANDFIKKMSDPNSISVDNLVHLYRMNNGGTTQQATPSQTTPSDTFQQTRNAQQVPSPMGVMPSGNTNVDGRSIEDKMIDTMIGNFNSKNPWK